MNASLVKELRDKTSAGMMDCKKALSEAEGDLNAAVEILRKKGIAKAAKKADRAANEGLIAVTLSDDKRKGVMVEVSCETDFVAKNDDFGALVQSVADKVLGASKEQVSGDSIVDESLKSDVESTVTGAVVKIGENLGFKRAALFEAGDGAVGSYIHMGGKIGVLLEVSGSAASDEVLKDVCMHIAATAPEYLNRDEVPADVLEKEKEILKAQLVGKPENILDKIIAGKIEKFYEEKCLVDQIFVKDGDKKIKDLLGSLSIVQFSRYQVGA